MVILEDFWRGDNMPMAKRYRYSRECAGLYEIMEQCEKELKRRLSAEDWALFQEFSKAQLEAGSLAECDNFMDGFRIDVKMMDVLMEPLEYSH